MKNYFLLSVFAFSASILFLQAQAPLPPSVGPVYNDGTLPSLELIGALKQRYSGKLVVVSDNRGTRGALTDEDVLLYVSDFFGKKSIEGIPVSPLANIAWGTIEGSLIITGDDKFTSIPADAFPNLYNITGDLVIVGAPNLRSIDGFASLQSVGGDIQIHNNPELSNCCIFKPLLTSGGGFGVGGRIDVKNNKSSCKSSATIIQSACGTWMDDLLIDDAEDLATYSTIPVVVGDVIISGALNIEDLHIQEIYGNLIISDYRRSVLHGWDELKFVDGNFHIGSGDMSTIDGFHGLESVGGNLTIDKSTVSTINGFTALKAVEKNLTIQGCNWLGHADTFSQLRSIGGDLVFKELPLFETIPNFQLLSEISGSLTIQNNPALEELGGLIRLAKIRNDITIKNNAKLSNCCSSIRLFLDDGLFPIGGDVVVNGNNSTACNTESGLKSCFPDGDIVLNLPTDRSQVRDYNLQGGTLVIDSPLKLNMFSGVRAITGNVTVEGNYDYDFSILALEQVLETRSGGGVLKINSAGLRSLTADDFPNLEYAYNLEIYNNPQLVFINSFPKLRFAHYLTIAENPLLDNITEFNTLDRVGNLHINFNPVLQSIAGFDNLSRITEELSIVNNSQLDECCALYQFLALGTIPSKIISNNGVSCANPSTPCILAKTLLGDFTIDTQAKVEILSFTTQIVGDVIISTTGSDPITNLSGLKLEKIDGDLTINYLKNTDLSAFNIQEITGNLTISFTAGRSISPRTNLDNSFPELLLVGGNIEISGNSTIETINNFAPKLQTIERELIISDNEQLTSITGFGSLDVINSVIPPIALDSRATVGTRIREFELIQKELGLSYDETLSSIKIFNNERLTTIPQFASLRSVKNFLLSENASLKEIPIFPNLESLYNFEIIRNPELVSIKGTSSLESIYDLRLIQNPKLSLLEGFQNLKYLGGRLVSDQSAFVNFPMFPNLEFIQTLLSIEENPFLEKVAAFPKLRQMGIAGDPTKPIAPLEYFGSEDDILLTHSIGFGSGLDITGNNSLTTVGGFSSLAYITGLNISQNDLLTSVGDFENLIEVRRNLWIGVNHPSFVFPLFQKLRVVYRNLSVNDIDRREGMFLKLKHVGSLSVKNNISEFPELETIGFRLSISKSKGLSSISGFEKLHSIGRGPVGNLDYEGSPEGARTDTSYGIRITDNQDLTSIPNFPALTSIIGDISVTGNPKLSSCCFINKFIKNPIILQGEITVGANESDCSIAYATDNCNFETITKIYKDIIIQNQQDADAFAQVEFLDGSLTIAGTEVIDISAFKVQEITGNLDITNPTFTSLASFSSLTTLGGNLVIEDLDNLNDVSGFAALETVGGNVLIAGNSALTTITGLQSIQKVLGILQISSNEKLTSLNTFNVLDSIGRDLFISNNDRLGSIPDFLLLQHIYRTLEISSNFRLTDIGTFPELLTVGSNLIIEDHALLTTIPGFEKLHTIGYDLVVQNNIELSSCCSLRKWTKNGIHPINGQLIIRENSPEGDCRGEVSIEAACTELNIIHIKGDVVLDTQISVDLFNPVETLDANILVTGDENLDLTNLSITDVTGNLEISGSGRMRTITAGSFPELTTLGGDFVVDRNYQLQLIDGFSALRSVGGDFRVGDEAPDPTDRRNDLLTSVGGFSQLTEIGGDIMFMEGPSLVDLSTFDQVSTVGGSIVFLGNERLNRISLFPNVLEIENLIVRDNPRLAACCRLLSLIAKTKNTIDIAQNAYECGTDESLIENCDFTVSDYTPALLLSEGGESVFDVQTTTPWRITNKSTWVQELYYIDALDNRTAATDVLTGVGTTTIHVTYLPTDNIDKRDISLLVEQLEVTDPPEGETLYHINLIMPQLGLAPILDLEKPSKKLTKTAGIQSLNVESNLKWRIVVRKEETNQWIQSLSFRSAGRGIITKGTASELFAQGNGVVTVRYQSNAVVKERFVDLQINRVADDGSLLPLPEPYNVRLKQEKGDPTLEITSVDEEDLPAEGGVTTFEVNSNTTWKIQKVLGSDWITNIDPLQGEGAGQVKVTYARSTNGFSRRATIRVSIIDDTGKVVAPPNPVVVAYTQKDFVPVFSVTTPHVTDLVPAGGNITFSVTSNMPWSINLGVNSKWVTGFGATPNVPAEFLTQLYTGGSSAVVTMIYPSNIDLQLRTAEVTFSVTEDLGDRVPDPIQFLFNQDTEPVSFSVVNLPDKFSHEAGSAMFNIISNIRWSIQKTTNADWVTLSYTPLGTSNAPVLENEKTLKGVGIQQIEVQYTGNPINGDRGVNLRVEVENSNVLDAPIDPIVVTLSQEGIGSQLTISTLETDLTPLGGQTAFSITSAIAWKITKLSNSDWLTRIYYGEVGKTVTEINGALEGKGTEAIVVDYQANTEDLPRVASLKIEGLRADGTPFSLPLVQTMDLLQPGANQLVLGSANESSELIIFPNPIEDELFIQNAADTEILIRGVTGVVVQRAYLTSDLESLDTSNLSSGIYILHAGGIGGPSYRLLKR